MSESIDNQTDELIGYILRKTGEDYDLSYEEVHAVLSEEREFVKERGIEEHSYLDGEDEPIY